MRPIEHRYPTLTHCPVCGDAVDQYAECECDEPFTAYSPLEGLTAWGAYSMPKKLKCNNGEVAHIVFASGQRLVRMIKSE